MIVYASLGYNSKQVLNVLRYCATCQLRDDCEIDLNYYETGKLPEEWNGFACSKWIKGGSE